MELNLRAVKTPFHDNIFRAWKQGDIEGILCFMPNTHGLAFVFDNMILLEEKGKYEEALVSAYIGTRTNWAHWDMNIIKLMFTRADPEKLTQAGDPIPDQELFTVYRGVGGNGRARRVNGFSWTDSLDTAIWFAKRAEIFCLNDPAVFTVTVPRESVMACCNERDEHEYLLKLPLPVKPKRVNGITFEGKYLKKKGG